MPYTDKDKARAAWKKWYQANKETHHRRVREIDRKKRQAIRDLIKEKKEQSSCQDCGESRVACLDFHHVEGEKIFNIGDAVRLGFSIHNVETEIDKCIVLCSNCHRVRHSD